MHDENGALRLLGEIEELGPLVRLRAGDADRAAALPREVMALAIERGLFRLWVPRRYGGLELPLREALAIYEAAARIDGSFGWAVMIGAGGGLFAASFDEDVARDIFGPADALIAGSGALNGRAERVPGGYRVQGRWRYASGAPYATTFTGNCVVTSAGEPVPDADGRPLIRAMSFPRADVEILETWNATGMRGTASHDFKVDDVLVAERRSFDVGLPPLEPGPLYRLPFRVVTELPVLAVALGIARHALDAFAELATRKRAYGSAGTLADDATVRSTYARAHATARLVGAGMRALADEAWAKVCGERELDARDSAEITATCGRGVADLRAAAGELAELAGMSAIDEAGELARAWRDMLALGAHFSVSSRHLASAGGTLLEAGLE